MAAAGVEMFASIQGLKTELKHGPSGREWYTVPPKDNGGDGTSFSPTDLVGAALASCALSTMALQAGREGLSWGDAQRQGGEGDGRSAAGASASWSWSSPCPRA